MNAPPRPVKDAHDALMRARAALARNDDDDARAALAHALRLDPRLADAWLVLGALEHGAGRAAHAREALDRAVDCSGGHPAALAARAAALLALGQPAAAAADARAALAREPGNFSAWFNLGRACEAQGDHDAACEAYARARALQPTNPVAIRALALCLQDAGRELESVPVLRDLLVQQPDDAEARLRLANALANSGRQDEADAEYRELLQRHPGFDQAHSTWLIFLQTRPDATPMSLLAAHRDWAFRHPPPSLPPFVAPARSRDRLRIGWLSPRFGAGPVATFFLPALQALSRERAEHWLFPCHPGGGAETDQFRRAADRWIPLWEQDDATAATDLRAAGLDVLVDLGGHAPGHRLRALAARCAPLQVSWLDYFCTTGIEAMDWFLTDPVLSPTGSERHFSENLLMLPHGRLCYAPPEDAPSPEPVRHQGLVLACFNRLNKLNPRLLAMWAELLAALPDARLRLKSSVFDHDAGRDYWRTLLAAHRIPQGRVELHGRSSHRDTLAAYRDVDIALDTFPFSGCATSADALWMGVPVVTLAGGTLVSRQTAALLEPLGLGELVASDAAGYISRVQALASDASCRRTLRHELPARMHAVHNVDRFAGALIDALEHLVRGN